MVKDADCHSVMESDILEEYASSGYTPKKATSMSPEMETESDNSSSFSPVFSYCSSSSSLFLDESDHRSIDPVEILNGDDSSIGRYIVELQPHTLLDEKVQHPSRRYPHILRRRDDWKRSCRRKWKRGMAISVCVLSVGAFVRVLFLVGVSCLSSYRGDTSSVYKELRRLRLDEKERVLKEVTSSGETDIQYTILITTSIGRVDLVKISLDNLASCPLVKEVLIDWRGMDDRKPPRNILEHEKTKVIHRTGKDDGEFIKLASTNAILLLADDVLLSCDELARAFGVWKENPDRLVGFFPYRHRRQEAEARLSLSQNRFTLEKARRGSGSYSVLSDRAAFVHRLFLKTYLSSTPQSILQSHHCDNFALSLKVTSMSSKPPIVIAGNPAELLSSETLKSIKQQKETDTLKSSRDCFSVILRDLEVDDLPAEKYTFIG